VAAWPDLPEAVRAGIMAMVQASGPGSVKVATTPATVAGVRPAPKPRRRRR
jgi:hypothetical protein